MKKPVTIIQLGNKLKKNVENKTVAGIVTRENDTGKMYYIREQCPTERAHVYVSEMKLNLKYIRKIL